MKRTFAWMSALITVAGAAGCGLIADKDLIEIAKIGNTTITRGDLRMAIRRLPAEEKPSIQTRADVRNALNDYIDRELKRREAARLQQEGKINVTQEEAERRYFQENPDVPDVRNLNDPSQLPVATTEAQLEQIKNTINQNIERKREEMLRDRAIRYLIVNAYETNKYDISDEDWEREYSIQKQQLFHSAEATVKGALVPSPVPDAPAIAAAIRQGLADGKELDAVLADYADQQAVRAFESTFTKDATSAYMQSFWQEVEGASEGDVVGPVIMEGRQVMIPDGQGGARPQQVPSAFLVGTILSIKEAKQKTLEEAKPDLAAALLYVKVMEDLRDQYNVEIYEDNLPDPAMTEVTGPSGPVKEQSQEPMVQ